LPEAHVIPQPPQFKGSVERSTQMLAPASGDPIGGHACDPAGQTQPPFKQDWPVEQAVLQSPQWLGLLWRSTHTLLAQATSGDLQTTPVLPQA
jgi:hypothetical protein